MSSICYLCFSSSRVDLTEFRNYVYCEGHHVSKALNDLQLHGIIDIVERKSEEIANSTSISKSVKSLFNSLPLPGISNVVDCNDTSSLVVIKFPSN